MPTPLARINPGVPAEIATVVECLLRKDPSDRPASATAVVWALSGSTEQVAMSTARRVKTLRLVAVAACFLLVAAVLVVVWNPFRSGGSQAHSNDSPPPVRQKGQVDVLVERTIDGRARLLRLNEVGACR